LSRQAAARERTLKLIAEGRWFRRGVPDGFKGRKVEVQEIRRRAKVEAKQLVSHMKKNGLTLDDQRAEDAMESMVEVVRAADDNGAYIHPVQYRIAAARAILDFTKQRPASKAEVALTKAEDFLAAVAAEAKGK
jgi:hypothetical protein